MEQVDHPLFYWLCMWLFCAPLFISLVCARECGEHYYILQSFAFTRCSNCSQTSPSSLSLLRIFRLGGVASCVVDLHLVTLVMVVSARVASCRHASSLAQRKKYVGGETSVWNTLVGVQMNPQWLYCLLGWKVLFLDFAPFRVQFVCLKVFHL